MVITRTIKTNAKFNKFNGQKYLKSDHPVDRSKLIMCPTDGANSNMYFRFFVITNINKIETTAIYVNKPHLHSIAEIHCEDAVNAEAALAAVYKLT